MCGLRPLFWPWDGNRWKPSTPRNDLIKAAALLIAEIERLDRIEADVYLQKSTRLVEEIE